MAPGAQKFGASCSNLRSFGSKCSGCIEEKMWDIVSTFQRPQWFGTPTIVPPCPITPLVWHLAIKCAAVKFSEPWMLNHFSELTGHNYVALVMYPECPTKDWRGKFCWVNTRESGPEIVQGLVGVTTSPTLLGPVLLWSQQKFLKLLLTVRYSKSS